MALMQIPRRVDYGLRAVIYLSGQDQEKCCSNAEISQRQGVPRTFLEKIIRDLLRAGLIRSKRGSCGGYALARPVGEISFYDVIRAFEGPIVANNCMDERLGCDQMPRCRMISVWSKVQQKITEVLSGTTLAALGQSPRQESIGSSSLSSAA